MGTRTIAHFTHPGHLLSLVDKPDAYRCGGCMTHGHGLRYECTICTDFHLHEHCGTCPRTITFFMHPHHTMTLMQVPAPGWTIVCNVCHERVEGMFYVCCNFHAHPICTRVPEVFPKAPAHPDHPLRAVWPPTPTTCHVCRGDCNEWRYRCSVDCHVDFHVECLGGMQSYGSSTASRGLLIRRPNGERIRKRDIIFDILRFSLIGAQIFAFGTSFV